MTIDSFIHGVEMLDDGTERFLPSFCLKYEELRLAGTGDSESAFTDLLVGTPPGMPPDSGMKIQLEGYYVPMPRSHLLRTLYDGELTELRSQQIDMLDCICIQLSMAAHWPRSPRGGYGVRMQAGRVLLRLLWQTPAHRSTARRRAPSCAGHAPPSSIWPAAIISCRSGSRTCGRRASYRRLGRASWPPACLRCRPAGSVALVDMDDFLVHSPTLEHHLHDVADVLEMSSKCEFGRMELGFLVAASRWRVGVPTLSARRWGSSVDGSLNYEQASEQDVRPLAGRDRSVTT